MNSVTHVQSYAREVYCISDNDCEHSFCCGSEARTHSVMLASGQYAALYTHRHSIYPANSCTPLHEEGEGRRLEEVVGFQRGPPWVVARECNRMQREGPEVSNLFLQLLFIYQTIHLRTYVHRHIYYVRMYIRTYMQW